MPSASEQFEEIDWDDASTVGWRLSAVRAAFLLAAALLAGAFLWDLLVLDASRATVESLGPVERYDATRLDWLFALSLLAFGFQVVAPLALRPERTVAYWRRLRTNTAATLSLASLVAAVAVGVLGPLVVGPPTLDVVAGHQPPVFSSVPASVPANCLGETAGGRCHGTWRYPLGTTSGGKGVLRFTVAGTRLAVQIALITAMLIVPLGTVVGTTAAYVGGAVDTVLMRLVDVVQTVPPFFAYIIVIFLGSEGGDVVVMLLVFGLLSWGKVARVVRSEALSVSAEQYVAASRDTGAGPLWVVREHVVPNVSTTAVTATTQQVSWLILTEAALSYLDLGAPQVVSWGTIIAEGTGGVLFGSGYAAWWVSTVPVVALAGTVVATNVLGDALRDVLDPRGW